MTPERSGIPARSRQYDFAAGGKFQVEKDFLGTYLSMDAPDIHSWRLRLFGTVTSGSGGPALGRDFAKLIANLRIKAGQEIVDCSGASLRVNEMEERGAQFKEYIDDIPASTTAQPVDAYIEIPYTFSDKGSDDRDSPLSLRGFLQAGGRVDVKFANSLPTNYASVDLQLELYADIKEGVKNQVSALLVIQEFSLELPEDQINVQGLLRALTMTSVLDTTGYDSQAVFDAKGLDSKTLKFESGLAPSVLRDGYRRSHAMPYVFDENLLPTPGATPWFWPKRFQKLSELPLMDRCHVKLNRDPTTNAVFLIRSYQDRHPRYSAAAAGYNSQKDYIAAIMKYGVVRGLTEDVPISQLDPNLVNKMPLQIKPASDKAGK